MELNKILCCDVLEGMSQLPNESINCIITSPPYWQLRDYQWNGQWGLEPTFQEYLEHLWQFMAECKRVLTKDGTIWVNLGDSYGTVSGRMGQKTLQPKFSEKANISTDFKQPKSIHKSLLLIPHRFAIGCLDRGFILRNDIIWAKRNGMPESVKDRFSKKHEFFFFFVKNEKYYFDLDSVKDKTITKDSSSRNRDLTKLNNTPGRSKMGGLKENNYDFKNPGDISDFWDVPTTASSKDHYASYNFNLIDKPIIAGCPKGGIILDPFCGTATTLLRAYELGRNIIGIEGSQKYVNEAQKCLDKHIRHTDIINASSQLKLF